MNILKNTKINWIITIVIAILCFVALNYSNTLNNIGMAAIIMRWLPFFIGGATLLFYFIANLMTKQYAWVVLLLGNLFNIIAVVSFMFQYKN